MFKNIKLEYSVKSVPSNDLEQLETLLNTMSGQKWELFMMNEIDSIKGGTVFACVFCRELKSSKNSSSKSKLDIENFKTRMEKILKASDDPYKKAKELQLKIKELTQKSTQIKSLLDSSSQDINRNHLNNQLSESLKETESLKNEFLNVVSSDCFYNKIGQEKLTITLSDELVYLLDYDYEDNLMLETVKLREELAEQIGYVIPNIRFTNDETLEPNQYNIEVRGISVFSSIAYPHCNMVFKGHSNLMEKPENAFEEVDQITGKSIFWIDEASAKNFWEPGLNTAQAITRSLEDIIYKYVDKLLDYQDANKYIDIVEDFNPFLVENIVPEYLTVGDIRYILATLLNENISIKDIVYIFEKLNDIIQYTDEREIVIRKLRVLMADKICAEIADDKGYIYTILLSESFCAELREVLFHSSIDDGNGPILVGLIKKIEEIAKNADNEKKDNIAVLTTEEIRRLTFMLLQKNIPDISLSVLSTSEVSHDITLDILQTID